MHMHLQVKRKVTCVDLITIKSMVDLHITTTRITIIYLHWLKKRVIVTAKIKLPLLDALFHKTLHNCPWTDLNWHHTDADSSE